MYLAQDPVQCCAVFISAVIQSGMENLCITLTYLTHPMNSRINKRTSTLFFRMTTSGILSASGFQPTGLPALWGNSY